jgi:hypothetical protein
LAGGLGQHAEDVVDLEAVELATAERLFETKYVDEVEGQVSDVGFVVAD